MALREYFLFMASKHFQGNRTYEGFCDEILE
jgi:hypothetical protein